MDPWTYQQSPIRPHLHVAKAALSPFSPSLLRFLCWLSHFCCSSLGTSSLLSKWCTLNSRKTKTKWRSCEPPVPSLLAAVPLPVASAGVGMYPAKLQLTRWDGPGRTHPSLWLVKDTDSASTDSVLIQAWLSSLQSCYLCIFNTKYLLLLGYSFSVYRAACTCLVKHQHWEDVRSTVIPILEWYLTLPSFTI